MLQIHIAEIFLISWVGRKPVSLAKRCVLMADEEVQDIRTVPEQNEIVDHVRYLEDLTCGQTAKLDDLVYYEIGVPSWNDREQIGEHWSCQSVNEDLSEAGRPDWSRGKLL